jgi:hypothetical protein
MAHGPYWADLDADAAGKRWVKPAKWDQLVNNIINWQADRQANGKGLLGLGVLTFAAGGYVGGKLDVRVTGEVARFTSGAAQGSAYVQFADAGGTRGYIGYGGENLDFGITNYAAGAIAFGTSNTERMRILANGSVGIGTESPNTKVLVRGTGQASTATFDEAGAHGSTVYVQDSRGDAAGVGGALMLGNDHGAHAVIKSMLVSGGPPANGDLGFFIRKSSTSLLDLVMCIKAGTGNIGIGTASPGWLLTVAGSAAKPGGGSWVDSNSDEATKENITPFTDGLDVLRKIQPYEYDHNGLGGSPKGFHHIGLLANRIEPHAPYCVQRRKGKLRESDAQETVLRSFDQTPLMYVLINAVRELDRRLALIEQKPN